MGHATFFGRPGCNAMLDVPADADAPPTPSSLSNHISFLKYPTWQVPADADEAAHKAAQQALAVRLARTPLPREVDAAAEYEYQDELLPDAAEQWAVIQFEQPVSCALPAATIGSHLDTDTNLNTCRLAFHGMMLRTLAPADLKSLRVFKHKRKEGQVEHRIASHRIASHRIASHRIASHRIASHRIASHRIA
jgi:hypothetical protein